ncbi:hypothetical protein DL991_03920 [Amycolatopsis sp. WAC 01375]|uniref:hypothetical protein n=1 Tax=unclassified Amycolatopsis TaxID=2618356 RepID=UPI000F7B16F9|nr:MULTISPECIES: hypothetical protein [unclassified Amycolatopsis]RSM82990.1 hypothetical protein DL991_03920 [Amycolatopsis sp. WAC 01375]RSN36316.1 hypothetical protein DL990_09360 [Amycolatopsis sp. WAC 01416]
MAKVPDGVDVQELTIVARKVLLDGLTALKQHLDALTVVGAQAVYLQTAEVPLAAAAYTSDGDLGVDPQQLADEPLLEQALRSAGFERLQQHQPGLWGRTETVGGTATKVELDLLVGQTLADGGSRSVKIQPHDKMAARRVPGLEPAVVDRMPMTITALESSDDRQICVHVAGAGALLVAKAHKIHDRLNDSAVRPYRLTDKDAGDVYRLMMGTRAREVSDTFRTLLADPRVGDVAATGLAYLREQFGGADTAGVRLAIEALAGSVPESTIRAAAPAYVRALPIP